MTPDMVMARLNTIDGRLEQIDSQIREHDKWERDRALTIERRITRIETRAGLFGAAAGTITGFILHKLGVV